MQVLLPLVGAQPAARLLDFRRGRVEASQREQPMGERRVVGRTPLQLSWRAAIRGSGRRVRVHRVGVAHEHDLRSLDRLGHLLHLALKALVRAQREARSHLFWQLAVLDAIDGRPPRVRAQQFVVTRAEEVARLEDDLLVALTNAVRLELQLTNYGQAHPDLPLALLLGGCRRRLCVVSFCEMSVVRLEAGEPAHLSFCRRLRRVVLSFARGVVLCILLGLLVRVGLCVLSRGRRLLALLFDPRRLLASMRARDALCHLALRPRGRRRREAVPHQIIEPRDCIVCRARGDGDLQRFVRRRQELLTPVARSLRGVQRTVAVPRRVAKALLQGACALRGLANLVGHPLPTRERDRTLDKSGRGIHPLGWSVCLLRAYEPLEVLVVARLERVPRLEV